LAEHNSDKDKDSGRQGRKYPGKAKPRYSIMIRVIRISWDNTDIPSVLGYCAALLTIFST